MEEKAFAPAKPGKRSKQLQSGENGSGAMPMNRLDDFIDREIPLPFRPVASVVAASGAMQPQETRETVRAQLVLQHLKGVEFELLVHRFVGAFCRGQS